MESNSGGSRDSGVPTTILQDTSIATESRSNYQQVLTSNFNDLQFEGIIGQGRFSTVWKCTTNTKVSFLKINEITNNLLLLVIRDNVKWDASSRWSFRLNSAWSSIETTIIENTHPTLL